MISGVDIRYAQPREVPRALLAQKTSIDLDAFYAWADPLPDDAPAFALVADDENGVPVAVLLAAWNPVYHGILVDTLVIDRAHRGFDNLSWLARVFGYTVVDVGKKLGARYVGLATPHPLAVQRLLRGMGLRRSEAVLRIDLEG